MTKSTDRTPRASVTAATSASGSPAPVTSSVTRTRFLADSSGSPTDSRRTLQAEDARQSVVMFTSTPTRSTVRRTGLALALPLAAVLALGGCAGTSSAGTGTADGSGSGSSSDGGAGTAATAPATTGTAAASSSGTAATTTSSDLETAARTALAKAPGTSLLSIELESRESVWEVSLAGSDGSETDVRVALDGESVVSGPTADPTDAEVRAENRRDLDAAKLSLADAVDAITKAQAGRITELALDDENGRPVWEADVVDSAGAKHTVKIDSATGAVVANAVDTDD